MTPVEALTQIRALHRRTEDPTHGSDDEALFECEECGQEWPCATVAVLDAVSVDATPTQGIYRAALVRTLTEWLEDDYPYEDDTEVDATSVSEGADRVLALVRPVEGAQLDPKRATEVLEWCKREGGLDLYGWGDLISRLQECIVPSPPNAQSKVSDAYRRGYEDARTRFGASS